MRMPGATTTWERRFPWDPDPKAVRRLAVIENMMSDEVASIVYWWGGMYTIFPGEAIRYMYEDVAFDLKFVLDEMWGRAIDTVGWCDWQWVDA